jgi:hypothetical protein
MLEDLQTQPESFDFNNFNFEPFISQSTMQQLTASVQHALSSIENLPSLTALRALSAVPFHPYERLKYNMYGPDYKNIVFKTINEIPTPENFDFPQAYLQITQLNKKIQDTLSHNLTCEPHLRCDTLLNTISGNEVILKVDKQREQIEFLEMIKSMELKEATHEQLQDYAKKIISEYMKMY